MEKAMENTIIAKNIDYRLSLKSFFKDKFRYYNNCYLVPFSEILHFKRQIFDYIYQSCGIQCSKLQKCHGHKFIEYIELIYQFNRSCILRKKIYFQYFLFKNFTLTSNKIQLKPTKIKSWQMVPSDKKLIHNLTYSERLSFLK